MSVKENHPVYNVFGVCFALLFAFLAADAVCNNRTPFFHYTPWGLALCALACCAVGLAAFVLWRSIAPEMTVRTEAFLVCGALAAYCAVLVWCGMSMKLELTSAWDFGVVFAAAQDYVKLGTVPGEYFVWFGNNGPLYALLVCFFKLLAALGQTDFMGPAIYLNAAAVTLTQGLFYLILRRLYSRMAALFGLAVALLCVAYYAYMPIIYTDTLSMPFVAGAVLLWLAARDARERSESRKSLLLAACAGAVCGAGAQLKFTVAIVAIAAAIDALLWYRKKWRSLLAAAAAFAVAFALVGTLVWNTGILPPRDKPNAIPYTHWVMMGLSGDGGYDDHDYKITLMGRDYNERVALNLEEIYDRLAKMGGAGLARHAANKLSYIYGDGLFYAPVKLAQAPLHTSPLHAYLLDDRAHFGTTAYLTTGLQIACLVFAAAGAALDVKKRRYGAMLPRVCMVGLTLFLLLWEARSRYLLNFLPLLMICGLGGLFDTADSWYNINQTAWRKKRRNEAEKQAQPGKTARHAE